MSQHVRPRNKSENRKLLVNVSLLPERMYCKVIMTPSIYLKFIIVSHRAQMLGPLCFLIYLTDFYLASKLKSVMFADDWNSFISDKNRGKLFQQMNKEVTSSPTWFTANALSTNIDKTKWAIIHLLLKSVSRVQNFQNYSLMALTLERETVTSFWMDLLIKLPYGKLIVAQFSPECLNV